MSRTRVMIAAVALLAALGGCARVDRGGAHDAPAVDMATSQLGNTQDVALKKWLNDKGLVDRVRVTNMDNPHTLDAFNRGDVQAAWLPEPWSSRLVLESGATVLQDEKTLWPNGKFPTTVLIVRTQFLRAHPQTVRALAGPKWTRPAWTRSREGKR